MVLGLTLVSLLLSLTWGGDRLAAQPLTLPVENSWIRIQNVGVLPATVELDFYEDDGSLVATDGCPAVDGCPEISPGAGWSFFQQTLDALEPGYQGSAFVTADQPFVALLARDSFLPDGTFQIAGDSLRLDAARGSLYLPLVEHTETHVARISVENGSETDSACVAIEYYQPGLLTPLMIDPPTGDPGCSRGGARLGPRATLFRDEHSLPVPLGFEGAAIVRTIESDAEVSADSQMISAVVDNRARSGPGLASYRALGRDELSQVVLLPLADREATEGQSTWSTRFRILSGTPELPNEVELLFAGTDAAGDEFEIVHTVVVSGALTCDQRLVGEGGCLPEGLELPSPFFGTVRMSSVDPVAVVAQRVSPDGALADYRGFTAREASRQIVLPIVNKNFGPWGDARGWNSWFRVLTFDGSIGHVTVIYYSRQFPNGIYPSVPTVQVRRHRTFRQWEESRLPDGWVGTALIVADRPVVVVANLESDVFQGDPVLLYNGISLE